MLDIITKMWELYLFFILALYVADFRCKYHQQVHPPMSHSVTYGFSRLTCWSTPYEFQNTYIHIKDPVVSCLTKVSKHTYDPGVISLFGVKV